MKTNNLLIVVAAITLLLSSCNKKDERILTIVNPDGTCTRQISFHPDATSAQAPLNKPIATDYLHFGTDWQRSWSVVGDTVSHPCPITETQCDSLRSVYPNQNISDKILLRFSRNYHDVNEMSDSLTHVVNHLFKASASLEKHFKWFYTEYVYHETFALTNIEQLFPVPLSRFVSADSASYWFTGKPDLTEGLTGAEQKEMLDEIEGNVSHWFNAITFTHICANIAQHYDQVKNPPVPREQFLANTDSITMSQAVRKMDLYGNIKQVKAILEDYYQTEAYSSLLSDSTMYWNKKIEKQYAQYQYLMMMAPTLDYVMPGKVIDAVEGKIEGDVVHYKFSGDRLIPHPYEVIITSRTTHVWAYIVTLLVILLAAVSLLYRRREVTTNN